MNTLPEDIEAELALLRRKLAGNRSFRACRGNFNHFHTKSLLDTGTPSQILARFARWVAARKVMLNLLATLKRDGHMTAYEELTAALHHTDFVITGEVIPLENTESGVLVIPNLYQALTVIQWLYTSSRQDAVQWIRSRKGVVDPTDTSLVARMFREIPSFARQLHIGNHMYQNDSSPTMHLETNAGFYDTLIAALNVIPNGFHRVYANQSYNDFNLLEDFPIGALISKVQLADILRLFNRHEQKKLSVWRFNYPQTHSSLIARSARKGPLKQQFVGLHPESEHDGWKKLWPSLTSINCTNGWGAVLLTKEQLGYMGPKTANQGVPKYTGLQGQARLKFAECPVEQHRLVFPIDGYDSE